MSRVPAVLPAEVPAEAQLGWESKDASDSARAQSSVSPAGLQTRGVGTDCSGYTLPVFLVCSLQTMAIIDGGLGHSILWYVLHRNSYWRSQLMPGEEEERERS